MKRGRLFILIERHLEGALSDTERAELARAVKEDPDVRRTFVEQVRLARGLAASLRPRGAEALWRKIAPLLTSDEGARRERVADAVEGRLAAGRRRRRSPLLWGGAAAVLAAAAALIVVVGRDRPPANEVVVDEAEQSAASQPELARAPAPVEAPAATPPIAAAPAPIAASPNADAVTDRARPGRHGVLPRDAVEMVASEGPAFAARQDVILYAGFEPGTVAARRLLNRNRLRSDRIQLGPGFVGQGLRVRYGEPGGPESRPVREPLVADATAAGGTGPEEVHLRYYVRLASAAALAAPGVLPGLCGGTCAAKRGAAGFRVRPRWARNGELFFENLPGVAPRARRWRRALRPDTWHAVEVRVKLNAPGAQDGVLEGWIDGERAISLQGVAFRDTAMVRVERLLVDTSFRGATVTGAPAEAHFDNLAVAAGYIGPRAP